MSVLVLDCSQIAEDLVHDLIGHFPLDVPEAMQCLADWLINQSSPATQHLQGKITEINPDLPNRYRARLQAEINRYGFSSYGQIRVHANCLLVTTPFLKDS